MNNQIKSPQQGNVDICSTNVWVHMVKLRGKKQGTRVDFIFACFQNTSFFAHSFNCKTAHDNGPIVRLYQRSPLNHANKTLVISHLLVLTFSLFYFGQILPPSFEISLKSQDFRVGSDHVVLDPRKQAALALLQCWCFQQESQHEESIC